MVSIDATTPVQCQLGDEGYQKDAEKDDAEKDDAEKDDAEKDDAAISQQNHLICGRIESDSIFAGFAIRLLQKKSMALSGSRKVSRLP